MILWEDSAVTRKGGFCCDFWLFRHDGEGAPWLFGVSSAMNQSAAVFMACTFGETLPWRSLSRMVYCSGGSPTRVSSPPRWMFSGIALGSTFLVDGEGGFEFVSLILPLRVRTSQW